MLLAAWAHSAAADAPPYERLKQALPRFEQIADESGVVGLLKGKGWLEF